MDRRAVLAQGIPAREDGWWRAERERGEASAAAAAEQRTAQEQVLRFQQNAWLTRHAKQRRFEFSGEQKRMLRRWFDALDADGSGKISVEELEDPMLSIGVVNDPKEINDIVGQIDKDSNGMIDFEEFVDFLTPHMKQKNGGSQDRHELMFRQLTEKMEHQSAGYLEINTQLSMERRRFILDSITRQSGQSIQEDLAEIYHDRRYSSLPSSISAAASAAMEEAATTTSAFKRAMERKGKLAALADRQRSEVRFNALEKVLTRNLKKLEPLQQVAPHTRRVDSNGAAIDPKMRGLTSGRSNRGPTENSISSITDERGAAQRLRR